MPERGEAGEHQWWFEIEGAPRWRNGSCPDLRCDSANPGRCGRTAAQQESDRSGSKPGGIGRYLRGHDSGVAMSGVVYTETVVHSAPEAFVADAPYQLVIVTLEGGKRVTGRVL